MKDAQWSTRAHSPFIVRAGNFFLEPLAKRKLQAGQLIDQARKEAGLHDLGDEFFVPALEVLLQSMHEEARLSPLGSLIQKKRITDLLKNRLRIEAALKREPLKESEELFSPVMIAGLQRTGTTLLHRLFSAHPQVRSLPSWEGLSPGPFNGKNDLKKRHKIAKSAEKGLKLIAPAFFAIHPVEAESVEEEVLLMELCFMSQTAEALMHVPSYSAWLERQDQTPVYQYMVRVLRFLQRRTPDKTHWVLKSPNHLEWLSTIEKVMPNLSIIMTHRNPLETVPSFCSMVSHGRAVFSDHVEATQVGSHWLRKIERLLRLSMHARNESSLRYQDLFYKDLIHSPQKELINIFTSLDLRVDEIVLQKLEIELEHSKKDRFGQHSYQLEDFGLNAESTLVSLKPYMDRYEFSKTA